MGYTVSIADNAGTVKHFYGKKAPEHKHGVALSKALIIFLTAEYPGNAPFSLTTKPRPGKPPSEAQEIDSADEATWP